jgi:Protein of unknown function (DUF1302)
MKNYFRGAAYGRKLLGAAVLAALAAPVAATEFSFGEDNDIKGSFNATLSAGAAWRMQGRDSALYQPSNGNQQGLPTGRGGNSDDGELNYGNGKMYDSFVNLIADLSLKKDTYGGLVRFKAWYDYTKSQSNVPHGNEANKYSPASPLSDAGFEPLAKFDGIYLLDAYVYNTWKTDGGDSINVRVGRQALNWGESLFIQGVNQISPLDIPALRRPGTEIKEAILPVGMVYANWGIANGPSIEGFYQFEWQQTTIDPCGTYFSSTDAGIGPKAASSGCNGGFVQAPDNPSFGKGLYVPLTDTKKASNGGQFGAAIHYFVPAVDTEFGLYGMNINSRVPVLSGIRGVVPFAAQAPLGPVVKAFWEYPDNIQVYGASASTTLAGWAVGAELSYIPNFPAQINGGDLLAGLLYGPAGKIPSQFWGPFGPTVLATPVGGVAQGWTKVEKTQFQVNAVQAFANVLGAENFTVAGEVAGSWASGFAPGLRYGRGFVFGIAQDPSYGAVNSVVPGNCPALNTPNNPGCVAGGFMTGSAWGYRLRGQLDYYNLWNTGVTVSPTLAWAQDVHGVSVDGQFNGGRQVLGLGVNMSYQKRYNMGVQYVWYANSAQWDALRDRDYISFNASMAF